MMAVDPADGCTFWYTQEYYETTSRSGWQTRIGSFKFPSCTSLPLGTLTGTVTDGTNPLVGAAVTAGGDYSTLTDATGVYTLELPVGMYDVTASMYGYLPATVTGIEILNWSDHYSGLFSDTGGNLHSLRGGDGCQHWLAAVCQDRYFWLSIHAHLHRPGQWGVFCRSG